MSLNRLTRLVRQLALAIIVLFVLIYLSFVHILPALGGEAYWIWMEQNLPETTRVIRK